MLPVLIVVMFTGGLLAGIIAANRGVQPAFAYFCIGAILPLIGVIVACVSQPTAPNGMVKVKCPRCDATTNVAHDAPGMECWQCHLVQGQPA